MKFTAQPLKWLTAFSAAVVSCSHAVAQDGTWTLNGNGNWSDTANWSGGTVADGTDSSAFLSNVISANRVITLDSARTIGNIFAQDISNDYSISGANTLTLDVSTGQSVLSVASGRTFTIGSLLTVNDGIDKQGAGALSITGAVTLAGAQTWTNNSTGAFNKTNASLLDNNGHDLTFDGTGTFNLGTINNATAVLTGSGDLIKNGTGRLNIGGVNSGFTGAVTINGGVLQMHNNADALGTGNLTLNGGVLSFYWGTTYTRTLGTGTNQVQILGGESGFGGAGTTGPTVNLGTTVVWGASGEGTATGHFNPGKFVLGDEGTGNAGVITFSSGIDLNGATRTIVVPKGLSGSGNTSTISGAITNSTGTAGLIKEGGGTLVINNASSSWNGGTTVTDGVLRLGNSAVSWTGNTAINGGWLDFTNLNLSTIGGGSGRNISLAAGAGVRFNALNNSLLNRIVETTNEITVMTGTITSGAIDLGSSAGANLPNAFIGNWAGNGAMTNISGTATITPGSDGYKFGSASSNGKLGIALDLADVGGSTKLTIGGNRVQLTGNNTFTGETFVRDGARLLIGNANALQNSPLNTGTSTNTGVITFANGAAGGTTPGAQTVPNAVIGGLTGSRNLSTMINQGNATATANGNAGNNSPTLALNSITGITLNPGAGLTHSYSGAIGNVTGSSTAFTVTMAATAQGTQELTGVNTYTGTTTINGGTLLISGAGSINSSSGVIIDGGVFRYNSSVAFTSALTFTSGTLAGTNLTGASFDNQVIGTGRSISPGNSPGTMNVGSQEWAGGGSYVWEINNVSGTAGADPGWDLLSGTGALTITADDLNPFNILLTSLDLFNAAGDAANFSDTGNYAWMIADFNSEITTFNADAFALNTGAFTNDFTGTFDIVRGDASGIGGDNTQIWVTYTAIPEPSTALLGALGVLLLFRRKR